MTYMISPVMPKMHGRGENSHSSGGAASNGSASPAAGSNSSAAPGTTVFGDLKGRDPDLIFAGEKISIKKADGTVVEHLVRVGQTLGGIASQYGVSLQSVIDQNQMAGSLLGTNSSGDYFTLNGPVPKPGDTTVNAPVGGDALPAAADLTRLRGRIQELSSIKNTPVKDPTADKSLMDKAISNPTSLTADERKRVSELLVFEKANPQKI